ncbi:molybdopterin synthase [Halodesulfurarchaeum formicicum]|uniref:Molybdopterin synthase catalytic subunit n=1 Tax=Halodesulfurarchaeum formicicum TaxID=1873524 RepID=A0A1J1AFK5_9EURY|nr:molybdopterin synthase [Halodesulfurarchaeum formicicum]APE96455.1 molybdopterin synthase catalytic subunit [Halodesulfurarchaeum formicicum]
MYPLGIVTGPETSPDSVLEPVLDRLEAEGSVGVVRPGDPTAERTVYEVGEDGWAAQGEGLDAESALSTVATAHDYGLLVDFPDAAVPQIAVGAVDIEEPAMVAESPQALDLDAVVSTAEAGEPIETLDSLIARVKASPKAELSGAIATFTGRVRAKEDPDDDPTESLTFEKYEGVAETRMAEIEAELTDRDGVYEVAMHHRVGRIERGEDIVFVVVLAGHRDQAFEAVEAGINRIKDEVPIFKKETTVAEEFWVHEREH